MLLKFSTKAKTLALLEGKIKNAKVLPQKTFSAKEWNNRPADFKKKILKAIGKSPWIVRSSSKQEDNTTNSNAGAFLSLLNINQDNIEASIDKVFKSYGVFEDDFICFIQPMIKCC